MATGTSVFLIALGAVLTFAVDASVAGLDIDAVGIILMIAGVLGLLVSLIWLDRLSSPRGTDGRVVEETETRSRRV